jgi:hypothetical protein
MGFCKRSRRGSEPRKTYRIPPGLKARVIRLNSAEFGSLPGVRGNG